MDTIVIEVSDLTNPPTNVNKYLDSFFFKKNIARSAVDQIAKESENNFNRKIE